MRYLRAFRPDLGFAVKELSHGLKTPTEQDWLRAKRIGRYLLGTPQTCIFFPRGSQVHGPITATSDSDWAGDSVSRKSTSSGVLEVCGCMIYDLAGSQSIIATSSGEAEFYAGAAVISESLQLREILGFFGIPSGIRWLCDSSVARAISERLGAGRVKHLAIRALWLQERVAKDEVLPVREPTQTNVADLNTKCHPQARFKYLSQRIGLTTLPEEVIAIPESKIMKFSTVTSSTAGGISGGTAARPQVSAPVLALAVALANVIGGARAQAEHAEAVGSFIGETAWLVTIVVLLISIVWWCTRPVYPDEPIPYAVGVAIVPPPAAVPAKPAGLPPGIVMVGGIAMVKAAAPAIPVGAPMGPPVAKAVPVKAAAAAGKPKGPAGPPPAAPVAKGAFGPKPGGAIFAKGVGDLIGHIRLETDIRGRPTGGPVMRAKSAGYPFGSGEAIRRRRDAAVLRQTERQEHPRTHAQLELELEYRDFQVGVGAGIERARQAEEHRAQMEDMRHQMQVLEQERDELRRQRLAWEAAERARRDGHGN